jgi:predicted nuclease with TOPRIM domain
MGCEGEVIVEMTPTEAVSMLEKAWQENKRLRQENATITAERDEARRELERLYDEKFRGNGALDLLADLDKECGL